MRYVLYSPGYGAGWSTWADDEYREFSMYYEPIIQFLESGGKFVESDEGSGSWSSGPKTEPHPILAKFIEDLRAKFGENAHFYLGGAYQLRVAHVPDDCLFRITEYDGSESIAYRDSIDWY
jgi:hypothetical protein